MRVVALIFFAWLIACASCAQPKHEVLAQDTPAPAPTDDLRRRAEELWTARRVRDCATLFNFRIPTPESEADRAGYVEWCKENEPFEIAEYTITATDAQPPWGWVRVAYRTRFRKVPDSPLESVEIWDKWFHYQGQWYPVPTTAHRDYPEAPATRRADAESRVRDRFLAAWELRRSRGWTELYQLVDPQDRGSVPEAEYARVEGLFDYLGRELHWVEVVADRGRVRVSYLHKSTDPNLTKLPTRTTVITENWIERNGEWFIDLRPEQ